MISFLIFIGETTSGDPLIDWLTKAGPIGILAFVVIAFMKGWIVSGPAARERLLEMKEQRDKALDLVYKHAALSERALEVSEKK